MGSHRDGSLRTGQTNDRGTLWADPRCWAFATIHDNGAMVVSAPIKEGEIRKSLSAINAVAVAPRVKCPPCIAAPNFAHKPPQSPKRYLAERLVTAFIDHCVKGGAMGCRLEFSTLYGWFKEWLEYEKIGACVSKNLFVRALNSIGIASETEWSGPPNKRVKKSFRTIRPTPLTMAA